MQLESLCAAAISPICSIRLCLSLPLAVKSARRTLHLSIDVDDTRFENSASKYTLFLLQRCQKRTISTTRRTRPSELRKRSQASNSRMRLSLRARRSSHAVRYGAVVQQELSTAPNAHQQTVSKATKIQLGPISVKAHQKSAQFQVDQKDRKLLTW